MPDLEPISNTRGATPLPFDEAPANEREPATPEASSSSPRRWAAIGGALAAWWERLERLAPAKRSFVAWAPFFVPLAVLPFLLPLMRMEIRQPLFGDTYIFQYTGWCINHGLRLYRDVGMADGPFIHFLHAMIQGVAGLSERGFRIADLTLHAAGGAAMGFLLTPRAELSRKARSVQRVAWGALGMTVWLSWYLTMDWTVTTEREAFYTLFGSVGMVLLYVSTTWQRQKRVAWGTAIGAFLVATQLFGKPTGAAYVGLGALSVLLRDSATVSTRWMRARMFGRGVAAAFALVAIGLLFWGSFSDYFFWSVKIPFYGNRFLFGVNWNTLLFAKWDAIRVMAFSSLFVGVAAIAAGLISVRALGLVVAPAVFWFGSCLQARGYLYHVVPVVGASHVLLLTLLSHLWEDSSRARWASRRGLWATIALAFVGQHELDNYNISPYRWNGDSAQWDAKPPPFAAAEQDVGLYLREHTQLTDRVFAYSAGENAHVVLFYARRRTAATFFHSFWLDPIGLLPQSQVKPDPEQLAALERLQNEIRDITCSTVEKNPPAAMAFNMLTQVFKVCPAIEAQLATQYDEVKTMGDYHIYMRKPGPS